MSTSKIVRKTLEEAQGLPRAEIDFSEKNLLHLDDVSIAKFIAAVFDCNDYDYCENPTMFYQMLPQMPRLWTMQNVTRLTLAHNKITEIPPAMANLENMEILNLFNNSVEEVPASLSSMPKLRYESENDQLLCLLPPCQLHSHSHSSFRILNLSMNRLHTLPRGFGSFPVLEVLDLSYNDLNEGGLPANFFMLQTLRALYLRQVGSNSISCGTVLQCSCAPSSPQSIAGA